MNELKGFMKLLNLNNIFNIYETNLYKIINLP